MKKLQSNKKIKSEEMKLNLKVQNKRLLIKKLHNSINKYE